MSDLLKYMTNKDIKNKQHINQEFTELLRDRNTNDNIDASLKAIYQNETDEISSSKRSHSASLKKREISLKTRIASAFIILLFLMSVMSWGSFLLLNTGSRLNTNDIEFVLDGPNEVIAGQENVYEIKYKNLSNFNLNNVEIYLNTPQNFIITDAVPAVGSNNTWYLDAINTKRSGRISIKAMAIGQIHDNVQLSATIKYRPENFSSTFDNKAVFTTSVSEVGIDADIEIPSFFNLDEEALLKVKYAKAKENYIDAFAIMVSGGNDFIISGDNQTGIWMVDNIPSTQTTLEIKGRYKYKPEDNQKLSVTLAVPREIDILEKNGDKSTIKHQTVYLPFYKKEVKPSVVEGALNMTLSINSSTSNKPVNFADTLDYVIHYKNASDAELKNVIIMAVVDSDLIDWSSLQDKYGGERTGNTLIWTKSEISDLADISPDEENSFGFSLKLKAFKDVSNTPINDLKITTYLDYSIDSAVTDNTTHAVEMINPINSNVDFTSELRYFDANSMSVGSGPLPPKVGEKTVYQVYWTVKGNLRDLNNVQVMSKLPDNINWESSSFASNGTIFYNSSDHTVVWKAGDVDAVGEPAMAHFAVSVIPADTDKNKILTIINESQLQAHDVATDGIITTRVAAKTSNLEDDVIGKGNGKVE